MSVVKWMRAHELKLAHAFLKVELASGFDEVRPIAPTCDQFSIADLEEDELAPRCQDCQLRIGQGS